MINENDAIQDGVFYSPSAKGFYAAEVHGRAQMPNDVIDISPDLHAALLDGQSHGKSIMPPDAEHALPWLQEPPAPTLEQVRATKIAEIMRAYDAAFAPIEAVYPAKERESWPIQLEEARAVLADPEAEAPMLSIQAAERGMGEGVAELAQKIVANNARYRVTAGRLTGQQQRMYAEVNALATAEDVAAYVVAYSPV